MSSYTDLNSLKSQKRSAQSSYDSTKDKIDALNEKIDRLKTARDTVSDCYHDYKTVKSTTKGHIEDSYDWSGTNKDKFDSLGSDLISADKAYCDNIDDARDALNNKITSLQNDVYTQQSKLGILKATINSLTTKIINYFNDWF